MIPIRAQGGTLSIPLKVTPKGGQDAILPYQEGDEAVHVKVSPPPEAGKANAAVIALFSRELKRPKRAIRIEAGERSRHKRVIIQTDNVDALMDALAHALGREPGQCLSVEPTIPS